MRVSRTLLKNDAGAALVEFTIVLPVLLLFGLGIIEFSRVIYQQHQITTGVADAARYLSHVQDPSASATAAKEIAVFGQVGGSVRRVSWWNIADVTVTTRNIANPRDATTLARPYRGGDNIVMVKVSTTATYTGAGFLQYLGFPAGIPVVASHEDRVIGN